MKERSRPSLCCKERAWAPGGGEEPDFGVGQIGERVGIEIAAQVSTGFSTGDGAESKIEATLTRQRRPRDGSRDESWRDPRSAAADH